MTIDDALLMAFADGELTGDDRAAVEAAVARDPALAKRIEAFRLTRSGALSAVPIRGDEAGHAALKARILGGQTRRARVDWRGLFAPDLRPALWGGLTACFVAGVAIGGLSFGSRGSEFGVDDGGTIRGGSVIRALDDGFAGEDLGGVSAGISFVSTAGHYCRTFTDTRAKVAGLACRETDGWRLEALAAARVGPAGGIRTASSDTPAPVLAAIDALIAGDALDRDQEAAARRSGWRAPRMRSATSAP